MTVGVKDQAPAAPEKASSDKELNFRKLEAAREQDREKAIRLEMQNQMLEKELSEIKEYLKPKEVDPFDDIDEFIEEPLKKKLEAKFNKVVSLSERKAEEAVERKLLERERQKEEAEKKNFLPKLKSSYNDFDEVMTEKNIYELGEKDPEFLTAVLEMPDEYRKRELLYNRIKKQKKEPEPTVQDKVQKNLRNPYFIPASAAPTSNALDFDLNAPGARLAAYQKLKQMQKK